MKRATCEGCALTHKILQASVGPIGPIGPIGPTIVANSETSPGSSTDLLSKGYFPELLMLLYISQDIPRLLVSFASEFPNGNQTWYFQAAKLSNFPFEAVTAATVAAARRKRPFSRLSSCLGLVSNTFAMP